MKSTTRKKTVQIHTVSALLIRIMWLTDWAHMYQTVKI